MSLHYLVKYNRTFAVKLVIQFMHEELKNVTFYSDWVQILKVKFLPVISRNI